MSETEYWAAFDAEDRRTRQKRQRRRSTLHRARAEDEQSYPAAQDPPSDHCYRQLGLTRGTDTQTIRRTVFGLLGQAQRDHDPVRWESIRIAGEAVLGGAIDLKAARVDTGDVAEDPQSAVDRRCRRTDTRGAAA